MPDYQQPSNANVFDRKAKLLQRERAAQVGIFSVSVFHLILALLRIWLILKV
jgi:hypothetical protein